MPKELGSAVPFVRGALWVDAETGQFWRGTWEHLVRQTTTGDELVMFRQESEYAPGRFGILVPQRIAFDALTRFTHPKGASPSFGLTARTTFSYGAFRRFDVGTEETIAVPSP